MRNYILIAAMTAMAVPGAAVAQDRGDVRQDRHEVRQDRHELRRDRQNLRQDRRGIRHNHVAYVAPYRNWTYRPVTVGFRLQPSFYGSRYYVTDYSMYNVRAPGRWQRWIRYGDDLLLVNTRTGRVLQVVHYRGW